jgi:hypothetical protein
VKYNQQETFFWLKGAVQLNKGANADYRKVQQSLERATAIVLAVGGHEISIDELDAGINESGLTYDYDCGLSISLKKSELARIAATGMAPKSLPGFWRKAGITTIDIKRALRRKRHDLFDREHIGIVPRFLVGYWCGKKGFYGMWKNLLEGNDEETFEISGVRRNTGGNYVCKKSPSFFFVPPLCFMSNGVLAQFVALMLKKDNARDESTAVDNVRKWVSRLGLKHATSPKIRGLNFVNGQIYFHR